MKTITFSASILLFLIYAGLIAARVSLPYDTGIIIRTVGMSLALVLGVLSSRRYLSSCPSKGARTYLKSFGILASMPVVMFFMGNLIIMNSAGIGSDL